MISHVPGGFPVPGNFVESFSVKETTFAVMSLAGRSRHVSDLLERIRAKRIKKEEPSFDDSSLGDSPVLHASQETPGIIGDVGSTRRSLHPQLNVQAQADAYEQMRK